MFPNEEMFPSCDIFKILTLKSCFSICTNKNTN